MKALILLLSLAMIPCSQAVQLTGTRGVSILAIDGNKIKNNFFSDKKMSLDNGEHQIVVRYTANHLPNDKEDIIESKPYIFNINVQGDTEITLKGLNTSYKSKMAIKDGLKWLVINNLGEVTIQRSDILQGIGFLPYLKIEKLIAAYNNDTIKLISKKTMLNNPNVPPNSLNLMTKNKTKLLMDIYNQATQKERKAFRIWLLEQEMK